METQDVWIETKTENIQGDDTIVKIEVPRENRQEWIVRHTDKFLHTKEELIKIIGDAFDTGAKREYQIHFGDIMGIYADKKQYINSIIKP